MEKDIIDKRLASLGYTVTSGDTWIITFLIEKVTFGITKECNSPSIPTELENVAVDMVCGEFLLNKKNAGQLTGFDLNPLVKSIKLGDTDTQFMDVKSKEQLLTDLINAMMNPKVNYGLYRRIRWTK